MVEGKKHLLSDTASTEKFLTDNGIPFKVNTYSIK